jgi:alpha-beta hydrolase superfamily lysophospholipase
MDAAMVKLKNYTLAGVAERIECPTLICHGANDRLSTLEVAQQLYEAVGARDKTLKVFTEDEGGVENCQADNRQVGTDYIADWLAQKL